MSKDEKKAQKEQAQAQAEARSAAMILLGISEKGLASGQESDAHDAFESKKSVIEGCDEIGALADKVKTFGAPIRITIESGGDVTVEPTRKVSFPKSVTNRADGGSRGTKCSVNGVEYESYAAGCLAHNLPCKGISGKVVLNAALRKGTITSFVEVVE